MSAMAHLKGVFEINDPGIYSDELVPFQTISNESHDISAFPIHMVGKSDDFLLRAFDDVCPAL